MYYHIRLDYYDSKIKSNQIRYIFDADSLEPYGQAIVQPFLHGEGFIFDGSKINAGEARALKFYSSEMDIERCCDIAQSRLSSNIIMVYHNRDMLTDRQFTKDITNEVIAKYSGSAAKAPAEEPKQAEKPYKAFISHSSKDKEFVSELVGLLEYIGLDEEQIICTSIQGYGIPLGENIFDYLKQQFHDYRLYVIFVHSDNYYQSPVCLNEMGAAWVLKADHCSLLTKGFDFNAMRGVVNANEISIKVDSDDASARLNELNAHLCNRFNIKHRTGTGWERHRDNFLKRVNQ